MGIIILKNMENSKKNSMKSRKISKKQNKEIEEIDDIEEDEIDEKILKKNNKLIAKKEEVEEISSDSEPELEEEIQDEESNSEENEKNQKDEKDKYFSNIKFEEFDIDPKTLQSLTENNFFTATEIQAKTIPLSLSGADIMGSAKTGSGKSLSFLIPAVETVIKSKHLAGTKVLILTSTRELALQLYNLAKDLLMYHKETCALI